VGIKAGLLKGKAWGLFLKLFFCLSFCLTGLPLMASWDSSFIEGLNAHGTDATIDFASGALLYNAPTNGQLPATRVNDVEGSCVPDKDNGNKKHKKHKKAKNCKASSPIATPPDDRLAFSQCTSASTQQIGPPTGTEPNITVEQGEYGDIVLSGGSDRTLTFNTGNGIYKMKSLTASSGKIVLSSGQYWIETLSINNGVELEFPTTGTVTFFIKNDYLHHNLNLVNEPERFLIYTYGDFELNGSAQLNAYVFAEGTATLKGSASLTGAVTANQVKLEGNSSVSFDDKVSSITTVPNCTITAAQPAFHIQYGKSSATSGSVSKGVVFDQAFPNGVVPLVFIMPTISDNNPEANDGPQSAFLSLISESGFRWTRTSPPNNKVAATDMPEVHWIAVTPGTYTLSNGTTLTAGSIEQNKALMGSNDHYKQVALPDSQNVQLNQLQTQNNNCWLTSTAQSTNDGIELAMDASEVRDSWWDNERCQPGNLSNDSLQDETIAYLAVQSGSGTLVLDGNNVNYHFGQAQTFNSGGIDTVANQCSYLTTLTGFTSVPTLVAGKNSRLGGDGGWLRRCQLTNDKVSMVVDEDTFSDSDRKHRWENYSFVAFEKKVDPLTCFTDDFNRSDVGDDWALKVLGSSLPPSIVNSRLRLTSDRGNQATSSTYQRLFPAANNLVELEFDYYAWSSQSGSGADGIAIILSDASITPQPGSFGGALGYAQRNNGTPGFAGGWMGIALDEYGNFSNPNEGKVGGPGFRSQAVAIRGSSGTYYQYLTGTNANISPKIDVRSTSSAQPNHKYKIIIDSRTPGKAMVSVLRDTLNRGNPADYVTLIAPFDALSVSGQAPVPEDIYLSITGSTGGSNNNHEIDNFKVCALKSNPIGQQIHHFEFDYTSSPLTCKPETMTVRACKDAACNLFTDPVQANLSLTPNTNGAWYVDANKTNVVKFENGSATVALRNNVTTPITIGVTSSVPSTIAGSNTLCRSGSGALNIASCTLSFAESGFIFDVPDKLANKPTGNISISAVKTSDITQQCVPLFSRTTKNIDFWSSYINPITPISGQAITVNNTVVGKQSSIATTLALAFDDTGKANIDVNYPDAGKMQLDAKYTGTGDEQGLVMTGSDQFVSFPVGLCVTPSAEESAAECSAGDSTCTVYKKAGESFDLFIQGKAWESDGDTNFCDNINNTPNYAHNEIELGHRLVAPAGGVLGEIGSPKYNHLAQTTNSNIVSQSVTEVGVFKFTAKPPSSYLGSSFYDIPLAASPNIGRFAPDRFVVSSSSVLPSCGSFTYMDQPFGLTLTLSTFNTGTYITKNYQGAFAKASANLVGENINNGVDLSGRLSALPINAGSWVLGEANVGLSYQANFSRTVAPSVDSPFSSGVDGPFNQLAIGVQAFDNDGGCSFIASPDMRANSSAICADSDNCNAKQLSTQDFRHGRVVMDNTYGPENEILRMPTYAQYWDGRDWVTNINDSCTHVTDTLGNGTIYAPSLTAGQTVTRSDGGSSVSSGQLSLLWQNSGSVAYRGQVTAPLQVDDWLKWYWNWGQVSPTLLYEPRASAFLGRYRGHDRIIYWREVGQ
jgi:MSHA biogenesis protein MshQ